MLVPRPILAGASGKCVLIPMPSSETDRRQALAADSKPTRIVPLAPPGKACLSAFITIAVTLVAAHPEASPAGSRLPTMSHREPRGSVYARAGPTVSAIFAPRLPSGFSGPVVVSRAVWCSVSAFSLAPIKTTMTESQIQVMKPMTAPSEP
jgi:hypothetical protein